MKGSDDILMTYLRVSQHMSRLFRVHFGRLQLTFPQALVIYVAATENYQALRKKAETDVGGYFSSVLCSMPKEDRLLIASALHKLDEALLSKEAEDAGL